MRESFLSASKRGVFLMALDEHKKNKNQKKEKELNRSDDL